MTEGLDVRPSATTYDVETLMNLAWRGQIRVPHFNRDFVWQRQDVVRLFDSILRGYPVGSLLLWRRPAPAATVRLGRMTIDAPQAEQSLWVVDGQQRIVSLANVLNDDRPRDPRFDLAYDLRNERIVTAPLTEDPVVVPLPVLFDLSRVLGWFGDRPEAVPYVQRANEVTRTLRQFRIPAYEVVKGDIKVLQDIFDRMNNYGKSLRRAEIFSALYAADEGADGALTFELIADHLDADFGFGSAEDNTLVLCLLARRGPDVEREIRKEFAPDGSAPPFSSSEFPMEDRDTAFHETEVALRLAVRFLQEEGHVPHITMLPYRYLIVVLTRFFSHFPEPDEWSRTLLRRWFWRAALVGPEGFKGGTTGALRALCNGVRPGRMTDSLDELLRLVHRPTVGVPGLHRFHTNDAATKIILCSWWDAGPRSIDDGSLIEISQLAEVLRDRKTAGEAVREILPRGSVSPERRLWAANRILLPVSGERAVSVASQLVNTLPMMSEELWSQTLSSHAISDWGIHLLGERRHEEFLESRQVELARLLEVFLDRACQWDFEDTPPLLELLIDDPDEE